jgi:hypothetical protein
MKIIRPCSSPLKFPVEIRFMQNQPNLVDLGLARLELLKSFTLASLAQQTSQNYLWVLRTDPDLNASLKEPLLDILMEHDHHLLVPSNENPNIQIGELMRLDPNSVWSGDLEWAKSYLEGKPDGSVSRVLESRLDADDALHLEFVETVQANADVKLVSEEPTWRIWCASRHVEWQYHAPAWGNTTSDKSVGALLSLKDNGCISAGLTIGYTEGVQVHDLPAIKHDQLPKVVPSCKKKKKKSKCLDFINLIPAALRARTPTSAGMLNILLKTKGKADPRYQKGALSQESLQFRLWNLIGSRFGFTNDNAAQLHNYLKRNMRAIAVDNLKGQCTGGHSCKKSSKIMLQTIIDHPESI